MSEALGFGACPPTAVAAAQRGTANPKFYAIDTDLELHLWTADDLDGHLVGEANLLRESYFGELIVSPDRLATAHGELAAAAGERWIPEVHQPTEAEVHLERMLAARNEWEPLETARARIERFATIVRDNLSGIPAQIGSELETIVRSGEQLAELLSEAHQALASGQIAVVGGLGHQEVPERPPAVPTALRRLRSMQHEGSLSVTNLVGAIREGLPMLAAIRNYLSTSIAVVVGEAGYGKTQLAAQLTAPKDERPAGVLLYGRHLDSRGTLDDLVRQLSLPGTRVQTFQELLAALDAAAERAKCRLPLVIDGLNEAENPSSWAPLLRTLQVQLRRFPSVLVVGTIRGGFVGSAVPNEVDTRFVLDGFDEDLGEAVAKYFAYYKIDAGDAELPRELLSHPLLLKIFCSVANPDRREPVGLDRLPRSLTGMFDTYLTHAARRIAELTAAIDPQDVRIALDKLGSELWDSRARTVPETRARELLGDEGRRWQESMLSALENDGVLIRDPGRDGGVEVSFSYDLLAGHVIASSLAAAHGNGIVRFLQEESITDRFVGDYDKRHPLASDIFDALVGRLPRQYAPQLWQVCDGPLRTRALRSAALLEGDFLDRSTVEEIARSIHELGGRTDVFDYLRVSRGAVGHPLNSTFLHEVLRPMAVAQRDARWTEWLRARRRRLLQDAEQLAHRWRVRGSRNEADTLKARWLMWTLTSSDRDLRDSATAALYWFGRTQPSALFDLTIESLEINDLYVSERMVAASYGVATAHAAFDPEFEEALARYLAEVAGALLGPEASAPTTHRMLRYYAASTIDFAAIYYPAAVPDGVSSPPAFAGGPRPEAVGEDDPRRPEVDRTLHIDFHNYVIGGLFEGRQNYDFEHDGHKRATSLILGAVHSLGWRADVFGDIDNEIADRPRWQEPDNVERYGKKYGWIGLNLVAGLLEDDGETVDDPGFDIDPTFPQPTEPAPVALDTWVRQTPRDDVRWLRQGLIRVNDSFVRPTALESDGGPWILGHAELRTEDLSTGRYAFGRLSTVLVAQADIDDLIADFDGPKHPARSLFDVLDEYKVFAGEIPWHARFADPPDGYSRRDLYVRLTDAGGRPVEFEVLVHDFSWERSRSTTNETTGFVPSRLVSEALQLRGRPASLDQEDVSGRIASNTFDAPPGFKGRVIYLREDLVRSYAEGRAIVTFAWGERRLKAVWPEEPSRGAINAYRSDDHVWRRHWVH